MRSRTSLIMASMLGLMGGGWIAPQISDKVREKKRRFGTGGTASTKGKRSRSLKARANRRKAKAKVK